MQAAAEGSPVPFFRRAMRLRSETAALRMAGLDKSPPLHRMLGRPARSSLPSSSSDRVASSCPPGPSVRPAFASLPIRTLREYKNRFRVKARSCTTKRQLVHLLMAHFSAIAVDEEDVVADFMRKLQRGRRPDEGPREEPDDEPDEGPNAGLEARRRRGEGDH